MTKLTLRSAKIIDPEIEGHYAYFPFVDQISTQEHYHDFYEVFLIVTGSIIHHVNQESLHLTSGTLVFIRPNDSHYFSKYDNHNCALINLAFLTHTFVELCAYLGLGSDEVLHKPVLPPMLVLPTSEKIQRITQLQDWGRHLYRDKHHSRTALRALLASIIPSFVTTQTQDSVGNTPYWLSELCYQMQQRQHTIEGRAALMRLANRSPEYVGRAFRQYLGTTPSQYINNLRLDYASDLLLQTDRPVIDICYDVGFGNLSHFYHVFKDRWNCSPLHFRKMNQRTLLPK